MWKINLRRSKHIYPTWNIVDRHLTFSVTITRFIPWVEFVLPNLRFGRLWDDTNPKTEVYCGDQNGSFSFQDVRPFPSRLQWPRGLKQGIHYPHVAWAHIKLTFYFQLLPYPFPCVASHLLISIIWWLGVIYKVRWRTFSISIFSVSGNNW
jgi:hypothetical protein